MAPRDRSVSLGERIEDGMLTMRRAADTGVGDHDAQPRQIADTLLHVDGDDNAALLGELESVSDQVDQHLLQPGPVAEQLVGYVGGDVAAQRQPFFLRTKHERANEPVELLAQQEGDRLERHPTSLDFRHIEDVVDDAQQRLGRRLHQEQRLALLRGEAGVEQQRGHAHDAVHRRPDLVAHVGEELALRPARLFCLVSRLLEFARLRLQLRHRLAGKADRRDHPLAQALGGARRERHVQIRGIENQQLERFGRPRDRPLLDEGEVEDQQEIAADGNVAEAECAPERRAGLVGDTDVEEEEQPAVVGAGLVDRPDEHRDVNGEEQRSEVDLRSRSFEEQVERSPRRQRVRHQHRDDDECPPPVGAAGRERFVDDDERAEQRHAEDAKAGDLDGVKMTLAPALLAGGRLRIEDEPRVECVVHGPSYLPDARLDGPMPVAAAAPGPKPSLIGSLVYRPGGADPLHFFTTLARTYGDVSSYRMAGEQLFVVNEPRLIRDVLVPLHRNFTKSRGLERSKRLLGEGLLTSEGAIHLRQRRLMQPAFHRDRIAGFADSMVAYGDRMRQAWAEGATLDTSREMNRLTLSIVGQTLFDVDLE